MKKAVFQQLMKEVQQGKEDGLAIIYSKYYKVSVERLQQTYKVMQQDAEDACMDALWVFRQQLIAGKIKNQNIGGYFFTIARNKYLEQKRKPNLIKLDPEDLRNIIKKYFKFNDSDFDPLIFEENLKAAENAKQVLILKVTYAYGQLGKKCQELLTGFIVDKLPLKVLQERLGYGSYNSIKASKHRCKNQFIENYKNIISHKEDAE